MLFSLLKTHTCAHTHTHTEQKEEASTQKQHFLLLTRNTVAAVFHLNEFLKPLRSPLLRGERRKSAKKKYSRLPNQLMCQEGERTKWSDKKKSGASLAYSSQGKGQTDREKGGFQTSLAQKSSLVHSSLNRPELFCLRGWLCIKDCQLL